MKTPNPSLLRLAHLLVLAAHAGTAIALLVLTFTQSWFDAPAEVGVTFLRSDVLPPVYDTTTWSHPRPVWFLFSIATIAAVVHALVASVGWRTYCRLSLARGIHAFAWVEYALCAPLIIVALLLLLGARDFSLLLGAALSTGIPPLVALCAEIVVDDAYDSNRSYHWRDTPLWTAVAGVLLLQVPLLAWPWVCTIVTVATAGVETTADMPWQLWIAWLGTLVAFAAFGLLTGAQLTRAGTRRNPYANGRFAWALLLLSVAAKMSLIWFLVGAMIVESP